MPLHPACQGKGDPGVDKGIDSNTEESDLLGLGLTAKSDDAASQAKPSEAKL